MLATALPKLEANEKFLIQNDPQTARQILDELVAAHPDLRFELTGDGTIVVMPPAGGESDYESAEVVQQLGAWAKTDGRGKAFGSSLGCQLPDGSVRAPDAAWISNQRLARLSKEQRRTYLPLTPDFVVEVKSPSDSERELREKCRMWMEQGAALVWLINGDKQKVWEYYNGSEISHERPNTMDGRGPVEGFRLDLLPIWAGLNL